LVSLVGKSGCGKSTLLNIIGGLTEPDDGEVFLFQKNLKKYRQKELSSIRANEISHVFQHYNLIEELTVFENIEIVAKLCKIDKNLCKTRLFLYSDWLGITKLLNKKVSELSGGEKQRTAILRALINDPKIILADEPTGALDEDNSIQVMEILKTISTDVLVIMVSHNQTLVEKYSDLILYFKNGRITDLCENEIPKSDYKQIKKIKYGSDWWKSLFKRHNKDDLLTNLLLFFSSCICLVSILITVGFFNGSSASLDRMRKASLEYHTAYISEKTYIDIEGSPLKLVKQRRPTKENCYDSFINTFDISIENDLSIFIPSYSNFELNNSTVEPCEFYPVYDLSLSEFGSELLVSGTSSKNNEFQYVIVNQEFVNVYNSNIGDLITFSSSVKIHEETIDFYYNFIIKGVVSEFSFLNSPKVYYSYSGASNYFLNYEIEGKDLIEHLNEANQDDPLSCYRYLVFLHREKYVDSWFKDIENISQSNNFISIDSNIYEVSKSFKNLTDSFSAALLIFVLFSIIATCLIIGLISYSNIVKRKKEIAILFVLGSRKKEIEDLFEFESIFVCLISSIVSLIFSYPLERVLNSIIKGKFNLENLIVIPYSSYVDIKPIIPIICIFLSLLIAFIGSYLPIKAISKIQLSEELRDE